MWIMTTSKVVRVEDTLTPRSDNDDHTDLVHVLNDYDSNANTNNIHPLSDGQQQRRTKSKSPSKLYM